MSVNAILACDLNYGIGKANGLPWPHNEYDMKWFKENTTNGIVVMGRKTWQSIGNKKLTNRINCVVSRNKSNLEGNPDIHIPVLNHISLKDLEDKYPDKKIWIIGGGEIYKQTIPYCNYVYLTQFQEKYDCDTYIDPLLLSSFVELSTVQKTQECIFSIWKRI